MKEARMCALIIHRLQLIEKSCWIVSMGHNIGRKKRKKTSSCVYKAHEKMDIVLILNCGITQCTRNISCVTLVLPQ